MDSILSDSGFSGLNVLMKVFSLLKNFKHSGNSHLGHRKPVGGSLPGITREKRQSGVMYRPVLLYTYEA